MATFTIKNVPEKDWALSQARAQREGLSMRQAVLRFIKQYGEGRVSLVEPTPVDETSKPDP